MRQTDGQDRRTDKTDGWTRQTDGQDSLTKDMRIPIYPPKTLIDTAAMFNDVILHSINGGP